MKVLHIVSDWKVTGPVENVVGLCGGLMGEGVEVMIACPRPMARRNRLDESAGRKGIKVNIFPEISKHSGARTIARGLLWRSHLRETIKEGGFSIIHSHLKGGHRVGARLARKTGVVLVQSFYDLPVGRGVCKGVVCGYVVPVERAKREIVNRWGVKEERVAVAMPGVDRRRFDPSRPLPDIRERFGFAVGEFVVGIVARVQKRRRFGLLLEAFRAAQERERRLRLFVVGRGSRREELAVKPAKKMGLEDVVRFAGYLSGDDYVGALKAMDAKVFLVPGTDGTCRALRQAMAMGKPVISTRRGLLPYIVEDGVSGLVVEENVESLAEAMLRLCQDRELRERLSDGARRRACEEFDLKKETLAVIRLYRGLLELQEREPRQAR